MNNGIGVTLGALALTLMVPAWAGQPAGVASKHSAAAERLKTETGAEIDVSQATGAVRFARAERGKALARAGAQKRSDHALFFLNQHARAFGLREARTDLRLESERTDSLGDSRVSYFQMYRGVPVFGATVKAHYDKQGNLKVVNGVLVPDIDVDVRPNKSLAEAGKLALAEVKGEGVKVQRTGLYVFREGLIKGVPGPNHLAFEVEVGNGSSIREFVYIDAHSGEKLDQITGIHDAMNRRAYDAGGAAAPGPTYPNSPYWAEGQAFPTASTEANNMLLATKETYDLFSNAFGRDSFNGAGATLDSIFNRGNACPNASWNGTFISFCPGITTDDVTAHEWGHAYTQYTHGLIYQWQSGALNESYSDIWGETVDRLNGRGVDSAAARTAGSCSVAGGTPPVDFSVLAPSPIAGDYFAIPTNAKPALPASVTAEVAVASPVSGCAAISGVAGKIALVDWASGTCGSVTRANNAIAAGAAGLIFVAAPSGLIGLTGSAGIISAQVSNATGNAIQANLPASVSMTIRPGTDNTVNWLIGEESTAPGLVGALRDMWNPTCYGNPGKVSDTELYVCAANFDGGGVHINSGIPNHAFALLVDGGTYNGQTVDSIGLTKAAHIYFRAMSVYQHPASNFIDHANAIEQSCSDLAGSNLRDLQTGAPSGQVITAGDCAQVATAALAVELRSPPTQCNFEPILDPVAQGQCPVGTRASSMFSDNFENGDSSMDRWTVARTVNDPAKFVPRDWTIVTGLPDRDGRAFFGPNPNVNPACSATIGSQAGALHLFSPIVTVQKGATNARLSFDHWVATEAGWDGGNLKISVNGGPFQLVQPADIIFNSYNMMLNPPGSPTFNDNPLAGQPAYSGSDGGSVDGSWGRTIVNLSTYAPAGAKVQLRFDMGTDYCSGTFGWIVDDVNIYTCKKGK